MPTPKDLANAIRRFVNKACKYDENGQYDESEHAYIMAAEQALATAWVNAAPGARREAIAAAQAAVHTLLTDEQRNVVRTGKIAA